MNQKETDQNHALDTLPEESTGVFGTWFNTNPCRPEISRLVLSNDSSGSRIRVFGTDQTAMDWGEQPIVCHVQRDQPDVIGGFETLFRDDEAERYLAANLKLGVLVIQCYCRFYDPNRKNYFTREFFHQSLDPIAQPMHVVDSATGNQNHSLPNAGFAPCEETGPADLSSKLGLWRNTFRDTKSITHLELKFEGSQYFIRAFGAGEPRDWGVAPVKPYAVSPTDTTAAGFSGVIENGIMESRLAANFNKGLLIIASFIRFLDRGEQFDYFSREFFYLVESER